MFKNCKLLAIGSFILIMLLLFSACEGEEKIIYYEQEPVPGSEKSITAFFFISPASIGLIDEEEKTITVYMPYGTNVSALIPVVINTGVSYAPSGAQDFSEPVEYTVTAEDESTAVYEVTVNVASSYSKAIYGFSFPSLSSSGQINENAKTISLTVPFGTDVTALTPQISHSGASYSPQGAQDFSRPVAYTVTAGDGSTVVYTVTVTVALSNEKAITSFTFPEIPTNFDPVSRTGVINESAKIISVIVPSGANITALVPEIVHTGNSITPSPDMPQDFTHPVSYTVTARNGTTVNYVVMVTIASSSSKSITSFVFESIPAVGVINESAKTISVIVPSGTNITNLTPSIEHSGESISPSGGQNFSSPVTYTVIPGSGTPQVYEVTVTVDPTYFIATNLTQYNAALAAIRSGGSGTAGTPKTYTINIAGDIGVPGITINNASTGFGSNTYIRVTLTGNGRLYLTGQGNLFLLGSNMNLVIDSEDLILQGLMNGKNLSNQDNNNSTIFINHETALLELKNGTITNNTSNVTNRGGGVTIQNGTFTMTGGKITGNKATTGSYSDVRYGGGVFITGSNSVFNLLGGEISDNEATSGKGGGVYIINNGKFFMSGGEIINNRANNGGGVHMDSASGLNPVATFTMTGGVIGSNVAHWGRGGGVYIGSQLYNIFNKIDGDGGGGIIYGNDAEDNSNTARYEDEPQDGHAIYFAHTAAARWRNATLWENDEIRSNNNPGWSIEE